MFIFVARELFCLLVVDFLHVLFCLIKELFTTHSNLFFMHILLTHSSAQVIQLLFILHVFIFGELLCFLFLDVYLYIFVVL
jgi:hypothetical protein